MNFLIALEELFVGFKNCKEELPVGLIDLLLVEVKNGFCIWLLFELLLTIVVLELLLELIQIHGESAERCDEIT